MRYRSTRGKSAPVDLAGALFRGLAPDGGLFVPERYPALPAEFLRDLPGTPRGRVAEAVLAPYLTDLPSDALRRLLAEALDFEVPLVPLDDDVSVLELFHGPTLAFKDVGARVMARLMSRLLPEDGEPLTILVATSGDTGSAVASAFLDVPRIDVVILYPSGKVSPLQERQLTTLGRNIRAVAVDGTFDDCQRMVKAAFADEALRARRRLTSANSINVGRLLPQAFYYVYAVAQLPRDAAPPVFCTPSGNFGNLCAGLIAKRMGLPCERFVAATNVNDTVPEFLITGEYRPRPSIATISNAMDVGDPSNFDRILDLYGGDVEALRRDVAGSRHDDRATRDAIREVHERHGYVLDPHTAVGLLGWRASRREREHCVLLATAHPAKFREIVEPVIGEEIPVPARLAECLARESVALPMPPSAEALVDHLSGPAPAPDGRRP